MTLKAKKDEAAWAFRRYARLGLHRRHIEVFEAYEIMLGVSKTKRDAAQLLTVFDTMRLLSMTDPESAEAVAEVYFFDSGRTPKRSDTSMRILRFATEHNCDERTVYRRLKSAKELYYHLIRTGFYKNT